MDFLVNTPDEQHCVVKVLGLDSANWCERSDSKFEHSRLFDFTSYVEIGRSRVTRPSAVGGHTFVLALVRLFTVLNL